MKDGTVYRPDTTLSVRGISNEIERTLGEVDAKLIIGNYETEHEFQVVGDRINIPYDGILGKDFFESKQATTDHMRKEIFMGKVILKIDQERQPEKSNKEIQVILKARCETSARLPARSKELETGLIEQRLLLESL
jgi:hypothetical protein